MNRYVFVSVFIVCSSVHAGEPAPGKEDMSTSVEESVDKKEAGALYSAYSLFEKPLMITRFSDDELSKQRLTGIGLIPRTSWVMIGRNNGGILMLNVQSMKHGVLVKGDKELFQSHITTLACASHTNRVACTTLKWNTT